MSAIQMTPVQALPPLTDKQGDLTGKHPLVRALIAVCVVNALMLVFTFVSILLIIHVNGEITSLREQVRNVTHSKKGDVSPQTDPSSKSFIIRGFDTTKGFNVTVEFPDNSLFPRDKLSVNECDKIAQILDNLKDDLRVSGGNCGQSNGSCGDNFLRGTIWELRHTMANIRSSQKIILAIVNSTSTFSLKTDLERLKTVIIQQVQSLQTRIGDMEYIAIEAKSANNQVHSTLSNLLTETSKIKSQTGLTNVGVSSIKTMVDKLARKSDCLQESSLVLTNLQTTIDVIGTKTETMQQSVSSLIDGDKSLTATVNSLTGNFRHLESFTDEMKNKCHDSEIKLTEVLAKVGVPTQPSTTNYSQVTLSFCSRNTKCKSVRVPTTHCYLVSQTSDKSWFQARAACNRMGGYLAEIDSELESQQVASMLVNEGYYWVGGSDSAQEGRWQWNHSGKSISMSVWQEKQPSQTYSSNCMAINKDGWSWGAKSCDSSNGYVCEKSANDCNDWLSYSN